MNPHLTPNPSGRRYACKSISKRLFFKHLIVLLLLITPIIILNSCREEDHTAFPSLLLENDPGFTHSDTLVPAGKTMRFKVTANGDGYNLTNFIIRVVSESERNVFDTGMNNPQLDWQGSFIKGFEDQEVWTFVIRDRWGNHAEHSITIGLDTATQFLPLIEHKNILLGAQHNMLAGSFYSLEENTVFFTEACNSDTSIQRILDLVHYYGVDLSTIASPGANIEEGTFEGDLAGWAYRNTTRFLPLDISIAEFEAYDNDSILIASYDDSQAKRKAKELSPGDSYVFKTQDGTLGMFLVRQAEEGDEGSVLLDLKIRGR